MNINFITLVTLLSSTFIFAQVVLTTNGGAEIQDGDVFTFSEIGEELEIHVTNNTENPIYTEIYVESIVNNSTNSNLQLCYGGICYALINEGSSYPSNPLTIQSNESNGNFDHMLNNYAGDNTEEPVSYELTFRLRSSATDGDVIEGSQISFTYTYNANLDVEDIAESELQCSLSPNPTADQLHIKHNTEGNHTISIYDATGKLVKTINAHFDGQDQIIDVSKLEKGVYLINIANSNESYSSQFIKN